MTPDEMQKLLVSAKLGLVRYRNALQIVRQLARTGDQAGIERVVAIALRERPGD